MNIIVTGAGKGIGLELCKTFLNNPDNTILGISRNTDSLNQLSEQNRRLLPLSFDLDNDNFEGILTALPGKIDILINNAGHLVNKPFARINSTDIEKSFRINFNAPFKLVQLLLTYFNPNAHVVNISSMGGFQGSTKFKGLSIYSASKSALACLTECLAEELNEQKIKVNCLCLGAVQTEMLDAAFPGYKAPVNANEMAKFIADFAFTGHHFMNGKIIPVSLSTP